MSNPFHCELLGKGGKLHDSVRVAKCLCGNLLTSTTFRITPHEWLVRPLSAFTDSLIM